MRRSKIDVWWPNEERNYTGSQPFKAVLKDWKLHQYQMFWQVDDGQMYEMKDDTEGYAHKEMRVDMTGWTWNATGFYDVRFVAMRNGKRIAARKLRVRANQPAPSTVEEHRSDLPSPNSSMENSNAGQGTQPSTPSQTDAGSTRDNQDATQGSPNGGTQPRK